MEILQGMHLECRTFGSITNNTVTEGSDIDLLIISQEGAQRCMGRIREALLRSTDFRVELQLDKQELLGLRLGSGIKVDLSFVTSQDTKQRVLLNR